MAAIKLIATDMDGTFLDEKGNYDRQRFRNLLTRLQQKGIHFVVASGRSYLALEKLMFDFREEVIFVAENGSLVMERDQVHYQSLMPQELYLKVIHELSTGPFGSHQKFLLSGKRGAYVLESSLPAYVDRMNQYYEQVQSVAHFKQVEDDIFKITADVEEHHILEGATWLTEKLPEITAVTTGFESIDVIQNHVDKSKGLEGLCHRLNIKPEEVVAFGDNLNDFGMLEYAGLSIATANARKEIKQLADLVIGPCSDASVLNYLEETI